MHLRQHQEDVKKRAEAKANEPCKTVDTTPKDDVFVPPETMLPEKVLNDTKIVEASSSTDAILTNCSDKEPENGVTSNELSDPLANTEASHNSSDRLSPFVQEVLPEVTIEEYYFAQLLEIDPANVIDPCQSTQPLSNLFNQDGPTTQNNVNETYHIQPNEVSFMQANEASFIQPEVNLTQPNEVIFNQPQVVGAIQPYKGKIRTAKCDFVCTMCERRFPSEVLLAKHIRSHEKKTQCEICGKYVARAYRRVHDKKYHSVHEYLVNGENSPQSL